MLRKMTKKRNELLLNSIQNLVTNSPFISSIMFLKSEQFVGTSYEKLIEMDFSAKAKKDSVWSKEDLQLLKKACEDIYSGKMTSCEELGKILRVMDEKMAGKF